jgi:amino acid adenylation domain-containing protein
MAPMLLQPDRSGGRSLRTGFFSRAAACPDAPALYVGGQPRSYGEIAERARRWAGGIEALAGGRAARVGVFAYRSDTAYTGVLAALASGAAFVPLNPTFPPARTAAMISAAALDAIIVDRTCAAHIDSVLAHLQSCPPLLTPELIAPKFTRYRGALLDRQALATIQVPLRMPDVVPDDMAYLLFTSGSTGVPKGVAITHGNALHFIDSVVDRYGVTSDDRFSQTFDQTFDLSVFDTFVAWERGASVCAMSPVDLLAPVGLINRMQITIWFSVPSVPAQMRKRNLLRAGCMPTLRWSLFCGEPLPRASVEAWEAAAPSSTIENLYGPTELTIACFVHRWHRNTSPALCVNGIVPIGRPLPGLLAHVMNDFDQPVGAGEAGELCVSGPQTSPGYWRDPERTAGRFPWIELAPYERRRFYRTGDRVMRLANDEYVYLGRADDQVKVLGHRVELGEVEAALRRDPRVAEVAAVAWPVVEGAASGIVAFVTGNLDNPDALKTEASALLPAYAVPRQILMVDEMPRNTNGKVNRRALVEMLASPFGEMVGPLQ